MPYRKVCITGFDVVLQRVYFMFRYIYVCNAYFFLTFSIWDEGNVTFEKATNFGV